MGKKFVGRDGLKRFWTKAKTWITGQITAEVTAKIAEIVANAPEDLDTLKEIADWIKNHANDASAMNTQINTNKSDISALKTSVAGKADKSHTHTKSEITDFPTSLEGFIKSKTVPAGDIRIPMNCYCEISVGLTSSDTVISAKLSSWDSNTGVFSVICYAKNRVYIVGDAYTIITNVSVQVFYI